MKCVLLECDHPLYWILPSPDDPGWRPAPRTSRMVDEHRLTSPQDSRTNNLFLHVPVYFTLWSCRMFWLLVTLNHPVLVMSQHALLFLMTSQEQVYQCWWLCITNCPIVRGGQRISFKTCPSRNMEVVIAAVPFENASCLAVMQIFLASLHWISY